MSCWRDSDTTGIDASTINDLSAKRQATYIFTGVVSLLFMSMLPAMYLYIKDYSKKAKAGKNDTPTKVQFYTGLVFIIVTIVCFGGSIPGRILAYSAFCRFRVDDEFDEEQAIEGWKIIFYSLALSYLCQTVSVTAILFQRVYYVFRGSECAISRNQIATFYGLLCLSLLIIIFLLFKEGLTVLFWLILCVTLMNIGMTSWTSMTFAFRLRHILDQQEQAELEKERSQNESTHSSGNSPVTRTTSSLPAANQRIHRVITKTSWLQWVSLTSFILIPIFLMCFRDTSSLYGKDLFNWFFGVHVSACIDIYVNLWCIMLSYTVMDPLYNRLCGRCHAGYARCCTLNARRRVQRTHLQMMSMTVQEDVFMDSV